MEEPPDDLSPLDAPMPEGEGWAELAPPLPPVGILAAMTDRSLANLAPYGKYHHFKPGAVVIRDGQVQDRFYIVVMGKLAISAIVDGKEMPLNETYAGECLGEVSLLAPGPASATVRVVETDTCGAWTSRDFAPISPSTWAAPGRCCSAWRHVFASACATPTR